MIFIDLNKFLRKTPLQTAISIFFWLTMLFTAFFNDSRFFSLLFFFAAFTDMAAFFLEVCMYRFPVFFPIRRFLKPTLYVSIASKIIFILCMGFGFGTDIDWLTLIIVLFVALGIRLEGDIIINFNKMLKAADALAKKGPPENPTSPE